MERKKVKSTITQTPSGKFPIVPMADDGPVDTVMDKANEQRPAEVKAEEMKLTLFDYRQEMAQIEALAAETGEITDEQAAALVAAHKGSIDKMKCLAWVVSKADQSIESIESEMKRLAELKAYRNSVIERIKKALVDHILAVEPERKKIDLDTYILKAHKCPASVQLIPEFDDPFYMRVTGIKGKDGGEISSATIDAARFNGDEIVEAPDKKAIKSALENKVAIEGATLVDNKHTLKIQ